MPVRQPHAIVHPKDRMRRGQPIWDNPAFRDIAERRFLAGVPSTLIFLPLRLRRVMQRYPSSRMSMLMVGENLGFAGYKVAE